MYIYFTQLQKETPTTSHKNSILMRRELSGEEFSVAQNSV